VQHKKIPAALEGAHFLREWHAHYAGTTSSTFWYGRIADDGRSSYALLVDDVAQLPSPATVVDLACGDGYLLAQLCERMPAAELVGIDMTRAELELALQRELPQNVKFLIGSAETLPLAPASVEAVVCHMAFMLFENARGVVEELARVLRPGGMFAAILGPAPGSSELVARYGTFLHEAEETEKLPPLHVGDAAAHSVESLRALFVGDAWSALRIDDVRLSFGGSDEQIQETLLGMYNVARLSKKGRDALAVRLANEIRRRREEGATTECTLGLRHLVVRRPMVNAALQLG
jgi:SAM-dependent methyltransferase